MVPPGGNITGAMLTSTPVPPSFSKSALSLSTDESEAIAYRGLTSSPLMQSFLEVKPQPVHCTPISANGFIWFSTKRGTSRESWQVRPSHAAC